MAGEKKAPQQSAGQAEARRRAEILGEYVALRNPSFQDDHRFAERLGLSTDALSRLAAAWRRRPDPQIVQGGRLKITARDRELARSAAAAPDLTGVDPARRAETRRRISVLRRYLDIAVPSREDLVKASASLDLSESGFRRLLRSWLLLKNAASLPGASTPMHTPKRRTMPIPADVEGIVSRALDELGPGTSSMELHRTVGRKCEALGLKPPAQSTLYHRLMEARARQGDRGEPRILIDHSALSLAVAGPAGPQVPVLSLVLAQPSGRILAHSLSLTPPSAGATAALMARFIAMSRSDDRKVVPLEIRFDDTEDWNTLNDLLVVEGLLRGTGDRPMKLGAGIGRTLGNSIGNIRLRPRSTRDPCRVSEKIFRAGGPISFIEATNAVQDAVSHHNARIRDPMVTFVPVANLHRASEALNRAAMRHGGELPEACSRRGS